MHSSPGMRAQQRSASPFHASSSPFHAPRIIVPRIDSQAAAAEERKRQARKQIEFAMEASDAMKSRKPKAGEQGGGLTARMTQGSQRSQECSDLAAALEAAVREGIDQGLDDHILMAGVTRVLELQQRAAEQAAAAKEAYEARAALAAAPIRTPRSREWRAFGGSTPRDNTRHAAASPFLRASSDGNWSMGGRRPQQLASGVGREGKECSSVDGASHVGARRSGKTPRASTARASSSLMMREGSLVQLRRLEGMSGISYSGYGNFDASLAQYNGRKGRVSRDPPAWVIKAAPEPSSRPAGADAQGASPAALVPVLLDSRSTDRDRGQGVWLALPPENLMVLQ